MVPDETEKQKKHHPKPGEWDFKVKVWERAALGDSIAAILRHFELHAQQNGYPAETPDRATISKTLQLVCSLTPEQVEVLPQALKAYARSRQPGLKAKKERPEQERLHPATFDPVVVEARRKHFDDLIELAHLLVRGVSHVNMLEHPPAKPFELLNEFGDVYWGWEPQQPPTRFEPRQPLTRFKCGSVLDNPELLESLWKHVRGLRHLYNRWQKAMLALMNESQAFYEHIENEGIKRTGFPDYHLPESWKGRYEEYHGVCLDELAWDTYLYATGNLRPWPGGREDKGYDVRHYSPLYCELRSWAYGTPGEERLLAEVPEENIDMVKRVSQAMRREYIGCEQAQQLFSCLTDAKKAATAIENNQRMLSLKRIPSGKCSICRDL